MSIERGHEQAISVDREAAVDKPAAGFDALRDGPLVVPDLRARLAIDRPRVILRSGDVQHAVDDDGCRFELAGHSGLEGPLRRQLTGVRRRDLGERAMPPPRVVSGVRQPARGIGKPIEQVLARNPLRVEAERCKHEKG